MKPVKRCGLLLLCAIAGCATTKPAETIAPAPSTIVTVEKVDDTPAPKPSAAPGSSASGDPSKPAEAPALPPVAAPWCDTFDLWLIRVSTNGDLKDVHFKTARDKANELAKKVANSPSVYGFREVAKKGDNDNVVGGRITEELLPSLSEAAARLKKVGEVSPVIETPRGYYILFLQNHYVAQIPRTPFDEAVNNQLRTMMSSLDALTAMQPPATLKTERARWEWVRDREAAATRIRHAAAELAVCPPKR